MCLGRGASIPLPLPSYAGKGESMAKKSYDVIVAGHICFDVIPKILTEGHEFFKGFIPGKLINIGQDTTSTGGPVSNTGIGLLKIGTRTGLMGKVGDDFFGRAILERLAEIGLAKSMTVVKGEHTSYTVAITAPGIDRIFLHCPGANNTFGFKDVNYRIVKDAKVFHFGYPPLMKKIYANDGAELTRIFRKAKSLGVVTSLDMSLPDAKSPAGQVDWDKALKRTLPFVDLFLPSGEESLFMLAPEVFAKRRAEAGNRDVLDFIRVADLQAVADRMIAYGAKIVTIKCGHRGIYLRTAPPKAMAKLGHMLDAAAWANRELWEPSFHVARVASATGSGDSSIAGFLSAFIRRCPVEQCVKVACAVGGFNVMAYDAVSGIRSWDQTTRAIARGWKKNPLVIDDKRWTFDRTRQTWFSPRDGQAG